jgi:hypothetical protein
MTSRVAANVDSPRASAHDLHGRPALNAVSVRTALDGARRERHASYGGSRQAALRGPTLKRRPSICRSRRLDGELIDGAYSANGPHCWRTVAQLSSSSLTYRAWHRRPDQATATSAELLGQSIVAVDSPSVTLNLYSEVDEDLHQRTLGLGAKGSLAKRTDSLYHRQETVVASVRTDRLLSLLHRRNCRS